MNLFKRGFTSVTRKAGKSAVLLVLIFILSNIIAGAISVQNAINKTREVLRDKMGIDVSATLDMESIRQNYRSMGDITDIASLTPKIIKEIGSSEYVKSYDYYTNLSLTSDTIELVESDNSDNSGGTGGQGSFSAESRQRSGGGLQGGGMVFRMGGGFQLSGGENPKVTAIENGDATMYDGTTFTKTQMDNGENVVLISKELAEKNNLSKNSKITLTRSLYKITSNGDGGGFRIDRNATPAKTLSFEFTVIGIFEPKAELSTSADGTLQQVQSSLVNTIYTSNTTINKINEQISKEEKTINGDNVRTTFNQYTPTYTLKNPDDLELFTATQKSKLPEYYTFTDNSDTFKNATTPMANLEWIARIILYVAIAATILILSLLITLFLRDRRHEMGIYLSLGERKYKVAGQILVEVMSIAIIAITLSVFSGNMLAKGISSGMLENQIVQEQQKASEEAQNIFQGPGRRINRFIGGFNQNNQSDILATTEEMKKSYSVTLDFSVIMLIYIVGICTIIISSMIPIMYTLRLKPKKILM